MGNTEEVTVEQGVKMIIALQAMGGKTETEEQATAGWDSMSDSEKRTTLKVYNMMFPEGGSDEST